MECYHCHGGFNFTDNIHTANSPSPKKVFTTGLHNEDGKGAYPPGHSGIAEFTGRDDDMGRVPHAESAQRRTDRAYTHDGSIASP